MVFDSAVLKICLRYPLRQLQLYFLLWYIALGPHGKLYWSSVLPAAQLEPAGLL